MRELLRGNPEFRRLADPRERVRRIISVLETRGLLPMALWIAQTSHQELAEVLGRSRARPLVRCRQDIAAYIWDATHNVTEVARILEVPRSTARSLVGASS